jgi:hypothetical protein
MSKNKPYSKSNVEYLGFYKWFIYIDALNTLQ